MRTLLGYDDAGHKRWSENQPSSAYSSELRGSRIVEEPTASDVERQRRFRAKAQAVTSIASILSRIEEAR